MPLSRDFKITVQERAQRDPAFRQALLREAVECFLAGDIETGKSVLRDYINATVGFSTLAAARHTSSKSLMRMLSPSGNPRADNLLGMVAELQHREGVRFQVKTAHT